MTVSNPAIRFVVHDLDSKSTNIIYACADELDLTCELTPKYRPFGITWDSRFVYVANRMSLNVYDASTLEYVHSFDGLFTGNPHQIIYHAGRIIGLDTSSDHVLFFTPGDQSLEYLSLVWDRYTKRTPERSDTLHANSLVVNKGILFINLHHRGNRTSQIARFRLEKHRFLEPIDTTGVKTHNLYSHASGFGYLDTEGTRKLVLNGQHFDLGVPEDHFLRGMCSGHGRMIISHFPRKQRRYRGTGDCHFIVFNPVSKLVVDRFTIEGVGAVNDMRYVGDFDMTHRNGYKLCLS